MDCYKAPRHLSCSETFYRDCFMEGLRTLEPWDSSERNKLVDMLHRLETTDSTELDDDDDEEDLVQR